MRQIVENEEPPEAFDASKPAVAYNNQQSWSKKSVMLESKLRQILSGKLPDILTIYKIIKRRRNIRLGILDTFLLPPSDAEALNLSRLFCHWEYFQHAFVVNEVRCES